MKAQIIQIEHYDDVVSLKDKVSWSKAARVILVWPRRGSYSLRMVDLVALRRHAASVGCQLGLVTRNRDVEAMAKEVGVAVFGRMADAQRKPWRQMHRSQRGRFRFDADKSKPKSIAEDVHLPVKQLPNWLRYSILGLGILAFAFIGLIFLPKATLTIYPGHMEQTIEVEVWSDPNLKTLNLSGGIPAHRVSMDVFGSKETDASGSVLSPETNAQGVVVFTNLTTQRVEVPAGTVVVAIGNEAVRFETNRSIVVPAGLGRTNSCPVVALLPGANGNVSAGSINGIEGSAGLYLSVLNEEAAFGGTDVRRKAPSQTDYTNLKKELLAELQQEALQALTEELSDRQTILDGSLPAGTILAESVLPEVGTAADSLRIDLSVAYEALAVNDDDIRTVARTALDANTPEGYQPVDDEIKINMISPPIIQADGTMRWKIEAVREVSVRFTEDELISAVLGRAVRNVPNLIAQIVNVQKSSDVFINPTWLRIMPLLPYQIKLEVQK